MEMVLAFLGFLACLIALGYGLYHLVRYVLKKENVSQRDFLAAFHWRPCAALYRGSIGRT